MIQINHRTGRVLQDTFGTGVDYVVLDTTQENAFDVDDITIDSNGKIFGVVGNSGGGGGDHLIDINLIGTTRNHGPLMHNGLPIQDMEGITLYKGKVLYGTTGVEFTSEGTDNTLYKIDKVSGETVGVSRLDRDLNGYIPVDFEAISCFPVCK